MMFFPRALVFTAKAPPSSAASAQVLSRLISGAEKYFCFVYPEDGVLRQRSSSTFVSVKHPFRSLSGRPVLWRFEKIGWYYAAVRSGKTQIADGKWDVVIGCHPDMALALAAAKVAKKKGLPFILYLMDLYAESRTNPVEILWARFTERKLLKQASAVICLTKGVQEHYSRKYGINPVLITHCVQELEIEEAVAQKPSLSVGSPIRITYSGGVYQARLDSLLAVKQAIEKLNAEGCHAQLLILGKNDPAQLASWGIGGPYVRVRWIKDRNEFMEMLRRSDILLSTIAFKSAYPLQDQTCFPTKTFDYFLSGKPIMVVAPEQADYITYMKVNRTALIITTLDVKVIAERICKFATELATRQQMVDAGFVKLDVHRQKNMQILLRDVLVQSAKISDP